MDTTLTCLGLESSCDETSASIVTLRGDQGSVKSNIVFDQADLHVNFGGVVPEIAARAHAERLDLCVDQALAEADVSLSAVDLIAVTAGPGLIGGVMSGVMCAKGLAAGAGKPLIGVNHLAGHALTPKLCDGLEFPYLLLLVSGGHCQFIIVKSAEDFTRLGGTIDDAPGEAFDKTARILGLPQPGGPSVEKRALHGNPKALNLPRPLVQHPNMDMSFSGLKTALIRAKDSILRTDGTIAQSDIDNLCATFQAAVTDVLTKKSNRAIDAFLQAFPDGSNFAVAGGVAANGQIRQALTNLAHERVLNFIAPPLSLCTDNAAMIAYAGALQFQAGRQDDFTLKARPRWPLDQQSTPMIGSGKKGPKA